jgi:energy-coupling factor transporter ATPase
VGTAQENYGAGAPVAPALRFRGVSFRYREDRPLALRDLSFDVMPGEFLTVVGGNGSGKSTLARLCNGLILPESGEVLVGGSSTTDPAEEWAVRSRVGLLFQNPDDQIVGASVEDDVAFGLENLGVVREEMVRRMAEVLDRVGLAGEEHTEPHLLSGGQKQRLALAGVLVLQPSVLVLDEPTSMLDPHGRDEIMVFLHGLTAQGVAVVMITQHMGEAVLGDRLLALEEGGAGYLGDPRSFFRSGASDRFPLGLPLPMALAKAVDGAVDAELPVTEEELAGYVARAASETDSVDDIEPVSAPVGSVEDTESEDPGSVEDTESEDPGSVEEPPVAAAVVEGRGVWLTYNSGTFLQRGALRDVDVVIHPRTVTAVVGATASGKSTLLQVVAGLLRPDRGSIRFFGAAKPVPGEVGMVFQRPETQLFKGTVREDVAVAPRLHGVTDAALDRRIEAALRAVELEPSEFGERPPYALSLGEQRRVALAGVMSLEPRLLVLDEPGAGLDPAARERLMSRLRDWAGSSEGRTLMFSSHDIDEVAVYADRVIVLHRGTVVAQGPVDLVLGDAALMEEAGLRPPMVSRVASRLGLSRAHSIVRAEQLAHRLRPGRIDRPAPAEGGAV